MPLLFPLPHNPDSNPSNPPGDRIPVGQRFLLGIVARPQNRIYIPPAIEEVFVGACETTITWADLMRESKIPDGIEVGMGVFPEAPPSLRGSLY